MNFLGIYFIEKQYVLLKYFWKNAYFTTTVGLFDFAIFQINFLNQILAVTFAMKNLILTGMLGLLVIIIAHFRMVQMQKLATYHDAQKYHENILIFFLLKNVEFISILRSINHTFGQVYFSFLVLNCPSNAFLIISLLFSRKTNFSMQVMFFTITITQIFFIFIVHYIIACQFCRIHSPAIFFFSVMIKAKAIKSFFVKMKLAHYLERFHTNNQYGFALGKCGTISYSSFGKVSLIIRLTTLILFFSVKTVYFFQCKIYNIFL